MDKTLKIAKHEFAINFKRKEFRFFAFFLPLMLVLIVLAFSFTGNEYDMRDFQEMQKSKWFFAFPSTIAMVFSLAIFLSANFLLQGIAEEKENRIMEVLLSSISFRELLMGKIAGLAFLGLIQFASWVMSGTIVIVLLAPEILAKAMEKFVAVETVLLYLVFFFLGYILYASILAAIGALTETRGEAQQIGSLMTVFALVPAVSTMFISEQTLPVSGALTLFPPTAPITAMIRIFLRNLPMAEALTSIAILILTIIAVIIMTSRIFRAEVLMYGKRFSPKELLRIMVTGK
ncbi:MAG: ABC transporter permease [Candidatus Diapherotrites archaeon]|uniref:ABC transporter permease n=1 Tax=Candidatus Iainarchaeum sp. TaxID=3101447 RepID=A0A939C6W0_9ARCH|nr:ABC transporter permease [Candidatus Diapherotrites archaeon]